jgi:predicted metal-binding membrane protein
MRRVRAALRWRPEWPLAVVGLVCWLVLIVAFFRSGSVQRMPYNADQMSMPSNVHHMSMLGAGHLTMMLIGTAAMMIPVGLRSARHVALGTFRDQRLISLTSFQLGYLLAPFAVTAGTSVLLFLSGVQGERWLVPVLLLVAGIWQMTPWKVDALGRCARTIPLRPFGWAATWSCTEFGIRRGARCLKASWSVMVLASVLGHGNLIAMFALTAVMVVESGPIEVALRSRRPVLGALTAGLVVAIRP